MNDVCDWPLGDGSSLRFVIYDPQTTTWNPVPGLYIFAQPRNGRWYAHYVGQTDDFSGRLANHENWGSAARLGATRIHAALVRSQADRDRLESMLITHLQPTLNVQGRRKVV